mgnify:CR=1 FL=1
MPPQPARRTCRSCRAGANRPRVGRRIEAPALGTLIDRIPVTKVSAGDRGGAYPAKAVVGESIPIRATVFREGHDAVNASVVLTDPDGNERARVDASDDTAGLRLVDRVGVAGPGGAVDLRVEGWSDPWETWVHNAEIKIPAGIDVALVCAEGKILFNDAAGRADQAGDTQTGRAAARCRQEPRRGPAGRGPAGSRARRRRTHGHAQLRPT